MISPFCQPVNILTKRLNFEFFFGSFADALAKKSRGQITPDPVFVSVFSMDTCIIVEVTVEYNAGAFVQNQVIVDHLMIPHHQIT